MRRLTIAVLCFLLVTPARAQDAPSNPWSFMLGIKQPEDGPTMPSLRVDLNKHVLLVDESFESVKRWRFRGRIDVATRAPMNPDDSFAEAAFGVVRPWVNASGGENLVFGLYADGRAESNQTVSEWLASGQLRVIISHLHHRGAWLLFPQIEIAAGATWAVESKIRETLGAESEANFRVEGEAYWIMPLRAFATGVLGPITLSAELRGCRTNGVDPALRPRGYDRGGHAEFPGVY